MIDRTVWHFLSTLLRLRGKVGRREVSAEEARMARDLRSTPGLLASTTSP